MQIIYVHGLDSSAQSVKGQLLEQYCKQHYPNIEVIKPDINLPPAQAFTKLCGYFTASESTPNGDNKRMIMGSSLGGYFSSLVSNEVGCPAVLLNPSTEPHLSLQRFVDNLDAGADVDNIDVDTVVYNTSGGWHVTYGDLQWFDTHRLTTLKQPDKVLALIKKGDELLDAKVAIDFYTSQGATVIAQEGGDHRMTDFTEQLPLIFEYINAL